MPTWWMFFIVFVFMNLGGICRVLSASTLCVWIDPRTCVVMVMSGFTVQPCFLIAVTKGL